VICARGLTVRRGGRTVLRAIDLHAERGEIVGLIGPPGSGKTTLLKAMAGLVPHTEGTLTVDGVPFDPAAVTAWQRRIGFAFQNNALFDGLDVWGNLAFALERRAMDAAEIVARIEARLAEVGLADVAQASVAELSGGMQKRLGLARATVTHPEIGFFDEPTAGLDPQTTASILVHLVRLIERHQMATVVVSNDLAAVLPVCHRVVMLHQASVVYDGAVEGLTRSAHPAVVQFATGADVGPL
jgi:phospholipid/cholesterol/gamma-HCH transport system ATP-binding protein